MSLGELEKTLDAANVGVQEPPTKVAAPNASGIADGRTPSAPSDEHLKRYEVYRSYIQHEDNLTNNRLNWNFTIQGFLFFSWVYCLQKVVDASIALNKSGSDAPSELSRKAITAMMREVTTSMTILGYVGVFVSTSIFFAALAAQIAIWQLGHVWAEDNRKYQRKSFWEFLKFWKLRPEGAPMAGIIGGGNFLAHVLGFFAPLAIPLIFVLAWLKLLRWHASP